MSIQANRAVAVLTPAVFAPLAGAISVFAAKHVPGVDIDADQLTAVFITGATIAFGKGALWLKGWQDYEKREQTMPADALHAADDVAGLDSDEEGPEDESEDDASVVGAEAEAEVDEFDEPEFDDEEEADLDHEPVADSHLVLNATTR